MANQLSGPCIKSGAIPLSSQDDRVQTADKRSRHVVLICNLTGSKAADLDAIGLAELRELRRIRKSCYYIAASHTGLKLAYPRIKPCLIRIAIQNRTVQSCYELLIADFAALIFLTEYEIRYGLGAALFALDQNLYPGIESGLVCLSAQNVLVQTIDKALHAGKQIPVSSFCCLQNIIITNLLLLICCQSVISSSCRIDLRLTVSRYFADQRNLLFYFIHLSQAVVSSSCCHKNIAVRYQLLLLVSQSVISCLCLLDRCPTINRHFTDCVDSGFYCCYSRLVILTLYERFIGCLCFGKYIGLRYIRLLLFRQSIIRVLCQINGRLAVQSDIANGFNHLVNSCRCLAVSFLLLSSRLQLFHRIAGIFQLRLLILADVLLLIFGQ